MKFQTYIRGVTAVFALTLISSLPVSAQDWSLTLDAGYGSSAIDEGAQRAQAYGDIALTAATPWRGGDFSLGAYMISAQGDKREIFGDELELFAALADSQSLAGFAGDWALAATWVSPPNAIDDGALEFTGALGFESLLSPLIEARYNADGSEYSAAVSAGPSWEDGALSYGARGSSGFVTPDEGEHYSYAGLTLDGAYALNERVLLGVFAKYFVTDADGFLRDVENGQIMRAAPQETALGVTLSVGVF